MRKIEDRVLDLLTHAASVLSKDNGLIRSTIFMLTHEVLKNPRFQNLDPDALTALSKMISNQADMLELDTRFAERIRQDPGTRVTITVIDGGRNEDPIRWYEVKNDALT